MPARRLLLVLLSILAALLAIAAFSWFGDGAELAPDPDAATANRGDIADAVNSDAERRDGDRGTATAVDASMRLSTASRATGKPPPPDPDKFLVRCVLASDGSPVADAEVLSADPDFAWRSLPLAQRNRLFQLDEIAQLRWTGRKATTDADGYVQLPRPRDGFRVVARKAELFGTRMLTPPEPADGFRIELAVMTSVTVRVLTADGAPAADLLLALATTTPGHSSRSASQEVRSLGHTDAQGLLVLEHLPALLRDDDGATATKARLFVATPGLCEIGADIDPKQLPDEVVELRLPPTGAVDLVVLTHTRHPLPTNSWFRFQPEQPQPVDHPMPDWFRQSPDGRTRFDHVPLGQQWRAEVWVGGGNITQLRAGPTRAGEVVTIELLADPRTALLRGRALDAARTPLADAVLHFVDQHGDTWHYAETDAEGRFTLLLGERAAGRSLGGELRRMDDKFRYRGQRCVLPERSMPVGELDLGDLVFDQAPELASGSFHGVEPLPEVQMYVERWRVDADSGVGDFQYSSDSSVAIDPNGQFRVYGSTREGRLRLHGNADGCEPIAPLEFVAGARNLRIELRRGATGAVRMLVHESLLTEPHLLVCELKPSGAESFEQLSLTRQDDRLAAELRGIVPGDATLRIRPYGHAEPLVVIDHLQITAGQPIRDERLEAIDLRTRVRAVRLRLVDHTGKQLEDAEGMVGVASPTRQADEDIYFDDGVAVVAAVGSVDVIVLGESHRPKRYQGPAIDADVVVEECLQVTVVFTGLPPLPAGCEWNVHLQRRGGPSPVLAAAGWDQQDWLVHDTHIDLLENGRVEFPIDAPGDFEATLHVAGKQEAELPTKVLVTLSGAGEHKVAAPTTELQKDLDKAWKKGN